MKPGASLRLEGVSFGYGSGVVLRDLSLEVRAGERVAVLGPNGAGKSTLLNLCSGVLRPRSGRVLLNGEDLSGLPPRERARMIAMVPQSFSVPFAFTVREWVSLGRTPYLSGLRGEGPADRAAVEKALGLAAVDALAGRLVGELSGGERQRAALGLALAQEPALLLLDEATAHLDLRHQSELLDRVWRLHREHGLTVTAAIHDVNLAALWFDRLVFLVDGRIVADGTPEETLREEVLTRVFGCPVRVLPHPADGRPLVTPERLDPEAADAR